MLLLLLLLLVHGAEQVQSLRAPSEQLRSRPRPHDVASASALHADALAAARKTAGRHGHTLTASSQQSAAPTPASGLILPSAFGADSTGKLDSTQAFARMIAALSNTTRAATPMMASGIHNLGGATLDLEGGTYLISAPLAMPDFRGNWRIRGGTLRASPSFPKNRFLIEVGSHSCQPKDNQNVCSEFVGMDNIFLDGGHTAAGCLKVSLTMGTTFGPSAFCTGFVDAGVRVNQGHETIIQSAWLAAYYVSI
jgi:hypothetical protein